MVILELIHATSLTLEGLYLLDTKLTGLRVLGDS